LLWIVILLTILVGGSVLNKLGTIFLSWRTKRSNMIRDMAIGMHDRGEYSDLVEYLSGKLSRYPNNPTVVYWLARGYLGLEQYSKAKKALLKLRELEPSWEEEYVAPYMKIISEKH
jgi:hypothetical protein